MRGERTTIARSVRPVWLVLAAVPPVALAIMIWRCGVDVPLLDEYELLGRWDTLLRGGELWPELSRPHHEHWMPTPLLVMYGFVTTTGWNIRAELFVNFLLGIGLLAVYGAQWRRGSRSAGGARGASLAVVAALTCAVTQHGNWLWGMQMSSWLALTACVAAFHLLTEAKSWRYLVAIVLGLVASSSQFQGNLVWPVGAVLLVARWNEGRAGRLVLAAWLSIGAVVLWTAYARLHGGGAMPAFGVDPARALVFVLAYLGGPVAAHCDSGAVVGGVAGLGMVAWLVAARGALRRSRFCGALVAFSVGAALLTAIGRVELGLETARATRYLPYATPMWIAVALMVGTHPVRAVRVVCLGTVAAACLSGSVVAWHTAESDGALRAAARQHVLEHAAQVPDDFAPFAALYADPELLELLHASGETDLDVIQRTHTYRLYRVLARHDLDFLELQHARMLRPDLHVVLRALVLLKQHRLSVFRDSRE